MESNQAKRVVAGVSDLFFASKITVTAKHVGMQVEFAAFVNHECTDLIEEAKQAGCDEVLTRGAFSQSLPELLRGAT